MSELVDATDQFGLVGQTLEGRFRVECQVAEGGFGVVYRAWQLALERPVALKVLKTPAGLDPREAAFFHQSFVTEARTMARLRHPHIVEVFDFGSTLHPVAGPLHWMAMEWLQGRTLEELLFEQRGLATTQPAQVWQIMGPVFEAIGYAHREGVVHRDLKPGNIFLVESGGLTRAKILDFGIAKITAPNEPEPGDPGEDSSAFSPEYAAPEQILQTRTGPFTDIHALALVLTEMLTGEPPYPGPGPECLEQAMIARRPTPASKGVEVGCWEAVLARALALCPAERYPSVEEFRQSLEGTMALVPVRTAPSTPPPAALVVCQTSSTVPWSRPGAAAGWLARLVTGLRRAPLLAAGISLAVTFVVWRGPRWRTAAADIIRCAASAGATGELARAGGVAAPRADQVRERGTCVPLPPGPPTMASMSTRSGCRGSSDERVSRPPSVAASSPSSPSSAAESCAACSAAWRLPTAALPLPRVQLGGSLAGKDSSSASSSASSTFSTGVSLTMRRFAMTPR